MEHTTSAARPDVEALASEVRSALDRVLAAVRRGDWSAASRRIADLEHATRLIETEVDFQYMNEWLEKAKTAVGSAAGPLRSESCELVVVELVAH